MVSTLQKKLRGFRAVGAALALLIGPLSGSVMLAAHSTHLSRPSSTVDKRSLRREERRIEDKSHPRFSGGRALVSTRRIDSHKPPARSSKLARRVHLQAETHQAIIHDLPVIRREEIEIGRAHV